MIIKGTKGYPKPNPYHTRRYVMKKCRKYIATSILMVLIINSSACYVFANGKSDIYVPENTAISSTNMTYSIITSIRDNSIPLDINKLLSQNSLASSGNWRHVSTETYKASVGDATFAAGIGVLASKVPGGIKRQAATALISYFLGVWSSGKFPSGYGLKLVVSTDVRSVNPSLGTYEQRTTNTVYYGKNGNYSKKAYSWTSTRTMYSSVDEEDTE